MENKLDLRVGDVVRLKDLKVSDFDANTVKACTVDAKPTFCFFPYQMISEVISRAETDAEKIARLEAELAKAPRRIEWGGGECPVGLNVYVVVWVACGERNYGPASYFWWSGDRQDRVIAYMVLPQ